MLRIGIGRSKITNVSYYELLLLGIVISHVLGRKFVIRLWSDHNYLVKGNGWMLANIGEALVGPLCCLSTVYVGQFTNFKRGDSKNDVV